MAFIATSNNTARTRNIDTLIIRSPTIHTPLAGAIFGCKHSLILKYLAYHV